MVIPQMSMWNCVVVVPEETTGGPEVSEAGSQIVNAHMQIVRQMYENSADLSKLDVKKMIKIAMDAIALNYNALHRIADLRINPLWPAINTRFRAICGREIKESEQWLFGADLHQRIKELKETSSVGSIFQNKPKLRSRGWAFLGKVTTSAYRGRQQAYTSRLHNN